MEGILLQKVPRGLLFIHFDFEPHIQNKNLKREREKKIKIMAKIEPGKGFKKQPSTYLDMKLFFQLFL